MACEAPCFTCPFSRHVDAGLPGDEEPWDFYIRHMDPPFLPYICPDQDDACFGQLTMMANQRLHIMIDDLAYKSLVYSFEIDNDNYFSYNNEFIRYHREGDVFGYEWTQKAKRQIGWIKPKEEPEEQLELF